MRDLNEWLKTCTKKELWERIQEKNAIIDDKHRRIAELGEELANYKTAIESGELVRLPCKVGDTVWLVYEHDYGGDCLRIEITKGEVRSVSVEKTPKAENTTIWLLCYYEDGLSYYHTKDDIGKDIFFTKAQAEAKLKELEGKK